MDDGSGGAKEAYGRTRLGALLPSQHFGPQHQHAPERRLMAAVLGNAVECLEKHRHATDERGRRAFDEAKEWLLADEPDWPCSFATICAVLDLDASAIRRGLALPRSFRKRP